MVDESPIHYKHGDVAWVKLGVCYWPGEVIDFDKLPDEIKEELSNRKRPRVIVKFFREDSYNYVSDLSYIYVYNCVRKDDFIRKGMSLHRAKNAFMDKFPADIVTAETKTNGDPKILEDPKYGPKVKKDIIPSIFGVSPKKKSLGKRRSSLTKSSPARRTNNKNLPHVTHRRFLGIDNDHQVRILAPPTTTSSPKAETSQTPETVYTCQTCKFTSTRINVIVLHNKTHIQGIYTPATSVKKSNKPAKRSPAPKHTSRRRFGMPICKTNTIDEDIALLKQGLPLYDENDYYSDEEDFAAPKRKKGKRKSIKKKDLDGSSADDSMTADDTTSTQARRKRTPKQAKSVEKVKKTKDKAVEEVVVKKDIRNDLLAEWDDCDDEEEESMIEKVETEKEPETEVATVVEKEETPKENDKPDNSCFDFTEEEEEAQIIATPGRKIPQVILPEKRKSIEPSEATTRITENTRRDSDKLDPDIDAFNKVLEETVVPQLLEAPQILKCEQNFHNTRTIKFPDKSEDTKSEIATKLTNPKKRFVKSFEDFELSLKTHSEPETTKVEEHTFLGEKIDELINKYVNAPQDETEIVLDDEDNTDKNTIAKNNLEAEMPAETAKTDSVSENVIKDKEVEEKPRQSRSSLRLSGEINLNTDSKNTSISLEKNKQNEVVAESTVEKESKPIEVEIKHKKFFKSRNKKPEELNIVKENTVKQIEQPSTKKGEPKTSIQDEPNIVTKGAENCENKETSDVKILESSEQKTVEEVPVPIRHKKFAKSKDRKSESLEDSSNEAIEEKIDVPKKYLRGRRSESKDIPEEKPSEETKPKEEVSASTRSSRRSLRKDILDKFEPEKEIIKTPELKPDKQIKETEESVKSSKVKKPKEIMDKSEASSVPKPEASSEEIIKEKEGSVAAKGGRRSLRKDAIETINIVEVKPIEEKLQKEDSVDAKQKEEITAPIRSGRRSLRKDVTVEKSESVTSKIPEKIFKEEIKHVEALQKETSISTRSGRSLCKHTETLESILSGETSDFLDSKATDELSSEESQSKEKDEANTLTARKRKKKEVEPAKISPIKSIEDSVNKVEVAADIKPKEETTTSGRGGRRSLRKELTEKFEIESAETKEKEETISPIKIGRKSHRRESEISTIPEVLPRETPSEKEDNSAINKQKEEISALVRSGRRSLRKEHLDSIETSLELMHEETPKPIVEVSAPVRTGRRSLRKDVPDKLETPSTSDENISHKIETDAVINPKEVVAPPRSGRRSLRKELTEKFDIEASITSDVKLSEDTSKKTEEKATDVKQQEETVVSSKVGRRSLRKELTEKFDSIKSEVKVLSQKTEEKPADIKQKEEIIVSKKGGRKSLRKELTEKFDIESTTSDAKLTKESSQKTEENAADNRQQEETIVSKKGGRRSLRKELTEKFDIEHSSTSEVKLTEEPHRITEEKAADIKHKEEPNVSNKSGRRSMRKELTEKYDIESSSKTCDLKPTEDSLQKTDEKTADVKHKEEANILNKSGRRSMRKELTEKYDIESSSKTSDVKPTEDSLQKIDEKTADVTQKEDSIIPKKYGRRSLRKELTEKLDIETSITPEIKTTEESSQKTEENAADIKQKEDSIVSKKGGRRSLRKELTEKFDIESSITSEVKPTEELPQITEEKAVDVKHKEEANISNKGGRRSVRKELTEKYDIESSSKTCDIKPTEDSSQKTDEKTADKHKEEANISNKSGRRSMRKELTEKYDIESSSKTCDVKLIEDSSQKADEKSADVKQKEEMVVLKKYGRRSLRKELTEKFDIESSIIPEVKLTEDSQKTEESAADINQKEETVGSKKGGRKSLRKELTEKFDIEPSTTSEVEPTEEPPQIIEERSADIKHKEEPNVSNKSGRRSLRKELTEKYDMESSSKTSYVRLTDDSSQKPEEKAVDIKQKEETIVSNKGGRRSLRKEITEKSDIESSITSEVKLTEESSQKIEEKAADVKHKEETMVLKKYGRRSLRKELPEKFDIESSPITSEVKRIDDSSQKPQEKAVDIKQKEESNISNKGGRKSQRKELTEKFDIESSTTSEIKVTEEKSPEKTEEKAAGIKHNEEPIISNKGGRKSLRKELTEKYDIESSSSNTFDVKPTEGSSQKHEEKAADVMQKEETMVLKKYGRRSLRKELTEKFDIESSSITSEVKPTEVSSQKSEEKAADVKEKEPNISSKGGRKSLQKELPEKFDIESSTTSEVKLTDEESPKKTEEKTEDIKDKEEPKVSNKIGRRSLRKELTEKFAIESSITSEVKPADDSSQKTAESAADIKQKEETNVSSKAGRSLRKELTHKFETESAITQNDTTTQNIEINKDLKPEEEIIAAPVRVARKSLRKETAERIEPETTNVTDESTQKEEPTAAPTKSRRSLRKEILDKFETETEAKNVAEVKAIEDSKQKNEISTSPRSTRSSLHKDNVGEAEILVESVNVPEITSGIKAIEETKQKEEINVPEKSNRRSLRKEIIDKFQTESENIIELDKSIEEVKSNQRSLHKDTAEKVDNETISSSIPEGSQVSQPDDTKDKKEVIVTAPVRVGRRSLRKEILEKFETETANNEEVVKSGGRSLRKEIIDKFEAENENNKQEQNKISTSPLEEQTKLIEEPPKVSRRGKRKISENSNDRSIESSSKKIILESSKEINIGKNKPETKIENKCIKYSQESNKVENKVVEDKQEGNNLESREKVDLKNNTNMELDFTEEKTEPKEPLKESIILKQETEIIIPISEEVPKVLEIAVKDTDKFKLNIDVNDLKEEISRKLGSPIKDFKMKFDGTQKNKWSNEDFGANDELVIANSKATSSKKQEKNWLPLKKSRLRRHSKETDDKAKFLKEEKSKTDGDALPLVSTLKSRLMDKLNEPAPTRLDLPEAPKSEPQKKMEMSISLIHKVSRKYSKPSEDQLCVYTSPKVIKKLPDTPKEEKKVQSPVKQTITIVPEPRDEKVGSSKQVSESHMKEDVKSIEPPNKKEVASIMPHKKEDVKTVDSANKKEATLTVPQDVKIIESLNKKEVPSIVPHMKMDVKTIESPNKKELSIVPHTKEDVKTIESLNKIEVASVIPQMKDDVKTIEPVSKIEVAATVPEIKEKAETSVAIIAEVQKDMFDEPIEKKLPTSEIQDKLEIVTSSNLLAEVDVVETREDEKHEEKQIVIMAEEISTEQISMELVQSSKDIINIVPLTDEREDVLIPPTRTEIERMEVSEVLQDNIFVEEKTVELATSTEIIATTIEINSSEVKIPKTSDIDSGKVEDMDIEENKDGMQHIIESRDICALKLPEVITEEKPIEMKNNLPDSTAEKLEPFNQNLLENQNNVTLNNKHLDVEPEQSVGVDDNNLCKESTDTPTPSTLTIMSELSSIDMIPETHELNIEKNLTVVSEQDLAHGQVEIAKIPIIEEGTVKSTTIASFSVDFTAPEEKILIKSIEAPQKEVIFEEKRLPVAAESIEKIEEEMLSSKIAIVKMAEAKHEEKVQPLAPLDVSSSKLLEILTDKKQKSLKGHSHSHHLKITNPRFDVDALKSKPKLLLRQNIPTPTPGPSKPTKRPTILSDTTIKSKETILHGTTSLLTLRNDEPNEPNLVSVQKVPSSKRSYEDDFEDIDTYIIQKPVKRVPQSENKSVIKKTMVKSKPTILGHTIIKPGGEVIQQKQEIKEESGVFDIDSMPIVLSDQILTPESIETMPIMIQEKTPAPSTSSTAIIRKVVQPSKVLNKSSPLLKESRPQPGKTYSKMFNKSAASTILKQTPTIINQSPATKPGKYVIVSSESSSSTPNKYSVSKKMIKKNPIKLAPNQMKQSVVQEPIGNKIMIVTNQQGHQSRVVLTPEQQRLMGYTTMKKTAVKTTPKSNIISQTIINPKPQGSITSSVISPIIQKKVPRIESRNKVLGQKLILQGGLNPIKASSGQPRTIIIKNPQGQTVKRIQGTDDALLEQQVAEQIEAINRAANAKGTVKPMMKRPMMKKVVVDSTKLAMQNRPQQMILNPGSSQKTVPPLAPISPKVHKKMDVNLANKLKAKVASPTVSSPPTVMAATSAEETIEKSLEKEQKRAPHQLVIQDALGNQTTITEGQILALPSETVDGQPQSYMLVTLDETGNLTPLNNEALMSLDPNLNLGGDMGNMVLQIDQGNATAETAAAPAEEKAQELPPIAVEAQPEMTVEIPAATVEISQSEEVITEAPQIIPPEAIPTQREEAVAAVPENMQAVACNINNGETNQQLIITGDPISTQKFLESLTEGNTDLANIIANAEGNILIHADGQQILINTDSDNQMLLTLNSDAPATTESGEGSGNPIFSSQAPKNQDILAAALADTDVFQQEQSIVPSSSKVQQSQLSPGSALYPINVNNVLETSSMSSPIMTPLEIPSTNSKKIDDEADILTRVVPKNVDLPITITDPNISQTVAHQQIISNELHTNLELPLSIPDVEAVTTAEMSSPSFNYSLPTLDDSDKPFTSSISMPLLTEEPEEIVTTSVVSATLPNEIIEKTDASKEYLLSTNNMCTINNQISSLSEPPPDMFDFEQNYEKDILPAENVNSPGTDDSCEIPVQPEIVTPSSPKRCYDGDLVSESKKCKFD